VNDALMALFFFVVGLEIKRELVTGELRDPRTATLPAVAALGGMLGPALIYAVLNPTGDAARGWGIPMATDIAFVVGIMALLGTRAPTSLKLFLLALAIADDIGAIAVIAIFYTADVAFLWLGVAAAGIAGTLVLRSFAIASPLAYVPFGLVVWVATLQSGVHSTVAGVALGLLTPALPFRGRSVLLELEHRLHPWTSHLVVPVFALANAGVRLSAASIEEALRSNVALGVALGLVAGKVIGIALAARIAVALGLGRLPSGVAWRHVVGGAALAGIGFTVALFITGLAFTDPENTEAAKIGVLFGSLIAATVGTSVLRFTKTEV
jgi:NhaA family Na+:H+ antiporter